MISGKRAKVTYLLEQLLELLMIVAEVSIVEHASDVLFVVIGCWLLLPYILHILECLAGLVSWSAAYPSDA